MKKQKTDTLKVSRLIESFCNGGYKITDAIKLDPVPEASKYNGLTFSINHNKCVYREGNTTPDRPGAFLALWKRPLLPAGQKNKPIPLTSDELDYLFVGVENCLELNNTDLNDNKLSIDNKVRGIFIFPTSLLVKKGIISCADQKGKAAFRVFPPWSESRGDAATKVFSESGKRTQAWQLPYFLVSS